MKGLTRRQFIRWTAAHIIAIAASAFLIACGKQETPIPGEPPTRTPSEPPQPARTGSPAAPPAATPRPAPITTQTPSATAQPSATPSTPWPSTGNPDLVVVRNGTPEELVQRALATLGGIERFVRRGNDVIVKPNICVAYHTYEYAATTNPWVVATLVKLCLQAGARRVRVMDSPFGGGPEEAYVRSGIKEQVEAAGGEMEIMASFKYTATDIPEGKDIRRWDMYDDVLKTDVLINVPIAKHHGSTRLTLGMKNLLGVIRNRSQMHLNLTQRIPDIASRIRPALTVIDAVRILIPYCNQDDSNV